MLVNSCIKEFERGILIQNSEKLQMLFQCNIFLF